jgi:DNA-binding CsgD family transcriptional regulator/tetratricopeptide (TPR) repeat protein
MTDSARFDASTSATVRLTPFAGREVELRQLRAGLERAADGHVQLLLLIGEPGIGKTRLAEELAIHAEARDCRVLWGSCHEWEGAPAYWPWVQVIRAAVRDWDRESLLGLSNSGIADVAQLVPELRVLLPDLNEHPATEADAARFRLFEGMTAFITMVARERPLVVVLDDLHWADTPSLLLLQFMAQQARHIPLLLVGTYRDIDIGRHHPLLDVLGQLARVQDSQRIALRGLAYGETRDVITSVAGYELPERTVALVQRKTEGNPFFVTEVARYFIAEAAAAATDSPGEIQFRVPESVREVIGSRLRHLSVDCFELLAVASIIGRDFPLRLLTAVSNIPTATVVERLDEAMEARLIDAGSPVGNYRFHHALIQEALYAGLPLGQRLRLHKATGAALESLRAPEAEPPLDELAYHFFQAAPLGAAEEAIAYAIKAAERSMTRFAWESAIENFQRASQVFNLVAQPDALQRCELLLALGEAQTLAERSSWGSIAARETFLQAAGAARLAGSGEHFARAALGFAGRNFVVTPGGAKQVALLEEALDRLGTADTILRVQVLTRLAIDRSHIDLVNEPRLRLDPTSMVQRLSDEAIAVGRRIGDTGTLARALLAKHAACSTLDNLDARIGLATEGAELAAAAGDAELVWWGYTFLLWDYAEVGDLERERHALSVMEDALAKMPAPFREWGVVGQQAQIALREGDYATAETLALRSLGDLPLRHSPWHLFPLRREQRRLHEIEAALEEVGELQPVFKARQAMQVLLAIELGREHAQALFDALAAREFRDLPATERLLYALILLAEACVALEDRQRALLLYDLLQPYADRPAAVLIHATHFGAVSQYLGMLATLLERWNEAELHFAHALTLNERLRLRPYAAYTRHAWATMLVGRGVHGDVERARQLNEQALSAAREIGMARLQHMATALAKELAPGARGETDHDLMGLSRRELDVLRLLVEGLSDREIADQLYISHRTVMHHVSSILKKLGVTSRTAAAALAVRHHLV